MVCFYGIAFLSTYSKDTSLGINRQSSVKKPIKIQSKITSHLNLLSLMGWQLRMIVVELAALETWRDFTIWGCLSPDLEIKKGEKSTVMKAAT